MFLSDMDEFHEDQLGLNPQAPFAQKIAHEVVFRHFQGEGRLFLNRTSLTPMKSLMRIFWKLPISAFPDFIFQWVLYQDHVLSQMVL